MRAALLVVLAVALAGCPVQRSPYERNDNPDIPDLDDDDASGDDDDASGDDDDAAVDDDDASGDDDDASGDDDDTLPEDDGPEGWIGGPCETSADCDYDDAVCLTDGFPNGMCTQACDLYCPDRDGYPVTFCVDEAELPDTAGADGDCVSRCDFEYFPASGCRPGYGCVVAPRANEPDTLKYVCVPGYDTDLSACHLDLADRGLAFEPTIREVDHPTGHPDLDCEIEDPVYLKSPVFGVDLEYYDGAPTDDVLVSCETAHAIGDTALDVMPYDAVVLRHIGTYNCRVISNTSTLSQYALANAIDIYGFEFADGTLWTLVDHWEHDTTSGFDTAAGEWLYDAGQRWFDQDIWNIILTPNYNSAHDNHFHVDLTAGGNYIGFWGNRYYGPAPYAD